MILKTIIFSGFLLANAFASTKPPMAVLDLQPNFEFGQVEKEFRVHYSGVGESTATSPSIKIFKKEETVNPLHTFTVSSPTERKVYYFSLDSADAGDYDVQVCDSADVSAVCSDRNSALTSIPKTKKQITCSQGKYNTDKTWTNDPQDPTFSISIIGAETTDTWVTADQIEKLEKATGYKSDWKKHGITKNPSHNADKDLLYAAVNFNILHFKQMFDKKKPSDETRQKYTHDFCERKYLFTANAHIVDKQTKEVLKRLKTTLFMSERGKQYFIFAPDAETRKVRVEMAHENVKLSQGTYSLQISFCATEKDVVESTFCSDPTIEDLVVSAKTN